ncbi:MAG: EAL domain-containing protein [Kineosporiaceae bacterium]
MLRAVGRFRVTRATGDLEAVAGAVMWLLLACYILGLVRHGTGFDVVVDGALGMLTQWVPAACCWVGFARATGRRERWPLTGVAVAASAYAAANSYYIAVASQDGSVSFPSWADAGYLAFCPVMIGALIFQIHRTRRGVATSVWLDSAVGSLGAAAVLAVLLEPVLTPALHGSVSLAGVISLAYPMGDLLLVAAVTGMAVLRVGSGGGREWVWLAGGLLVFAASDVVYALRLAADAYQIGTPLDAGWPLGLAMLAVWVHQAKAPRGQGQREETPRATGAFALAVPAVATAAAAIVLIYGARARLSLVAVLLAGLTLAAAAGRTQLVFRQLVRFADVRRQAATDDLTGLPNRRAFYVEVPRLLASAQAQAQALLLLDLDRFKEVNDSLGHQAGDQLLVRVGRLLLEQLRPDDMLARLGGDEFAILLSDTDQDQAAVVADKLRAALAAPIGIEGIALYTDASIGIAMFPEHGRDLSLLLRRADIAMYRAKSTRGGRCVYTTSDDTHGDARLRTLQELRVALSTDQFILHFQPKISLTDGRVCGVEALVRWDHPARGLLYPDAFLQLVEDSGLMPAMTHVVLDQALDQAAAWSASGQPLTVAVNLSASSLVDGSLPDRIAALLRARGLPSAVLQLEITEEFLMTDRDRARAILARLRDQGIQIAVDDFGTGFSSLAYLRDLPIDELKLDRSFVFPIADDARAAALVASAIALAHSLGLRMVAEGVEDHVAYTELKRYGCDQAQGYYLSRPLPAPALEAWIDHEHTTRRLAPRHPDGGDAQDRATRPVG